MTKDDFVNVLNVCYDKALHGLPLVSESVDELANEYLKKYPSPEIAAKKFTAVQIVKCGTSGFITGLGGLITLPVAIPANISSVIYVQLRMVACIAYMGGFNPADDAVRTMAYVCLTGQAATDILKRAGIQFGEKFTANLLNKIPGAVLVKINQKVGFRFVTKFGEKGVINLGKVIPLVGGVIGGGLDVATTSVIAKNAFRFFLSTEQLNPILENE